MFVQGSGWPEQAYLGRGNTSTLTLQILGFYVRPWKIRCLEKKTHSPKNAPQKMVVESVQIYNLEHLKKPPAKEPSPKVIMEVWKLRNVSLKN